MVVPHFVDKNAVDAHGKNLDAKILKILVIIGDRRYFGRSDEGKITGVKAEDYPLSKMIREFD